MHGTWGFNNINKQYTHKNNFKSPEQDVKWAHKKANFLRKRGPPRIRKNVEEAL